MKKIKRKKMLRADLENALAKYERRIQKLAQEAYYIRKAIVQLDKQDEQPTDKGGIDHAVCEAGIEAGARSGETNTNGGESELLNNEIIDTLLEEQPTELPSN